MRDELGIEMATITAKSHLGRMYKWGGDDPSGFDCSGLVVEILQSAGILPNKGDWSANSLYHRFISCNQEVAWTREGILMFVMDGELKRAIHVEYCINDRFTIGASGGDSKVLSIEDALDRNAFVKIRPIRVGTYLKFADPFEVINI